MHRLQKGLSISQVCCKRSRLNMSQIAKPAMAVKKQIFPRTRPLIPRMQNVMRRTRPGRPTTSRSNFWRTTSIWSKFAWWTQPWPRPKESHGWRRHQKNCNRSFNGKLRSRIVWWWASNSVLPSCPRQNMRPNHVWITWFWCVFLLALCE